MQKVSIEAAPKTNGSSTCAECEKLSAEYESATIRWFRLDNQMRIAEFGLDPEASARIASERAGVGELRLSLRRKLHDHFSQQHETSVPLVRAAA